VTQLLFTCLVDLPDDFFEKSAAAVHVKEPVEAFRQSLTASGLKFETSLEEVKERQPKAPRAVTGKRRGRRSKAEMAAAAAAAAQPISPALQNAAE
jgi:hypothetical protein